MTAAASPGTRESAAPLPPPGAEEMLRLENASVRFGDVVAVHDVSLSVPRGTILGLIGPSGAGKTTTIRLLTGGLNPSSGRVVVLGEDPRRFRRHTRERIGYMPQLFTLYPDLSAGENIDFVASLYGLLWFRRRRRVREVLELVDLWDVRGRRAGNLSGGQQRRLELACALVHEPDLHFLDEPTAGIDPLLRARVWSELRRLRDEGRTLIVTTQYLNEAEACDNVALIAQGRIAALAPPEELRREATGGDIIEVETARAFDGQALVGLGRIRRVMQDSPRSLRVAVDEAGAATPAVVAAIGQAGGEVLSAREYRLTFDEIFAELVERQRRRMDGMSEEDNATLRDAGMAPTPEGPPAGPEPPSSERAAEAGPPAPLEPPAEGEAAPRQAGDVEDHRRGGEPDRRGGEPDRRAVEHDRRAAAGPLGPMADRPVPAADRPEPAADRPEPAADRPGPEADRPDQGRARPGGTR